MKLVKQKMFDDQRGVAFFLLLVVIVIILSVLGLVGYKVYQTRSPDLSKTQNIEFNQNLNLQLNQTATLGNGNEAIKFRFTKLEPPSNPHAQCEELCMDVLPTIMTELEYAGKTFKGTSTSEVGGIDMSFEENGAYVLVPYTVELVSVDFSKHSGTVKITQKNFTKVEFGKQFTLENDGVAAVEPGKTGVHIGFGVCGVNSPCIRDIDFYVNDEYVSVFPLGLADPKATPEFQFASKDGSHIEQNGVRLRLIESDDKTYATFVLEKI